MFGRLVRFLRRVFKQVPKGIGCVGSIPDEVTYDSFRKSLSTVGYYCRYEGGICFSDLVAYNLTSKSLTYVVEDTPENTACPSIYAVSYDPQSRLLTYAYYTQICTIPAITVEETILISSQVTYSIVPKDWGDFMEEWI